jgi:hypothetical protein
MPEGLRESETGELLRTRAEGCEAAADSIDEIVDEWETAHDDYQTALAEWDEAVEADRQDEAEEPDEVDEDEFLSRIQEITIDT